MANLEFDTWIWEYASQSPDIQEHLEQEIIGGGWLYRQDSKTQKQVMEGAPQSFIERVAPLLKPEIAISLGFNPYIRR